MAPLGQGRKGRTVLGDDGCPVGYGKVIHTASLVILLGGDLIIAVPQRIDHKCIRQRAQVRLYRQIVTQILRRDFRIRMDHQRRRGSTIRQVCGLAFIDLIPIACLPIGSIQLGVDLNGIPGAVGSGQLLIVIPAGKAAVFLAGAGNLGQSGALVQSHRTYRKGYGHMMLGVLIIPIPGQSPCGREHQGKRQHTGQDRFSPIASDAARFRAGNLLLFSHNTTSCTWIW